MICSFCVIIINRAMYQAREKRACFFIQRPENVFCVCNRCDHSTCLCVLQPVCGKRQSAHEPDRREQCHPCHKCPRGRVYVWKNAIICATVGIMCPAMSFLAAWFYYLYYTGFNIWTLLANWLKLACFNFPFAYFTQLFFIQPAVRVIFKTVFGS